MSTTSGVMGEAQTPQGTQADEGAELRRQAWDETAAKSRRGIIAFPTAFGLVAGLAGAFADFDPVWAGCGLLVLGSTLARAFLIFRFEKLYERRPVRWVRMFTASLLVSAGAWGLFTAWVVQTEKGQAASMLALLISTALVGQSVVMYAASFRLIGAYIGVMVPPLFVVWASDKQGSASWLAGGTVVYCVYLLASARGVSRHLWQRLERSQQLRVARDRLEDEVSRRAENQERIAAELRDREQEYQRIYQQAHDAILIIDPENEVVLEANDRAVEIYGFDRQELVGMSLIDISINPEVGREKVRETLREGHFLSFETSQRRKDGSIMDLEVNASVIEYRGINAILSINRDVTDRKRAHELRLAKEAAERMSDAKSQFLANMSHEIRTPMAGMIGLANLLRQAELGRREKEWVETLHASAESLLVILDDVLDLSKIEDGKLELVVEHFDLRAEIHRVVDLVRARAETQGLDVEVFLAPEIPVAVLGDAGRLRQVLLNLLSNAVKFTPQGSVSVAAEWSDRKVSLAVSDTGTGIEPEHLERIFDSFTQRDASTSRRYGGTGLGLAICRKLVRLMGGHISVESEVGEGSTFRFTVPFKPSDRRPEPPEELSPAVPRIPASRRVLLVEDNEVNRLVALAELERLGVVAEAVADGLEALELLGGRSFDLLLMDVQMPGLDGYETTRRIRAGEPMGARTPIVALTAHALQGEREKCLSAGMDDYLAKPVRQGELAAMLARWLPS